MLVISHLLLSMKKFKERCQIVTQLYCLGRVEEIGKLGWNNLHWVESPRMRCVRVELSRSKTKHVNDIFLFPHRTEYRVSAVVTLLPIVQICYVV